MAGKFFPVESGILGFGIPNTAQGIRISSSTDKNSGFEILCDGIQNPRQSWNSQSRGEKDSVHAARK